MNHSILFKKFVYYFDLNRNNVKSYETLPSAHNNHENPFSPNGCTSLSIAVSMHWKKVSMSKRIVINWRDSIRVIRLACANFFFWTGDSSEAEPSSHKNVYGNYLHWNIWINSNVCKNRFNIEIIDSRFYIQKNVYISGIQIGALWKSYGKFCVTKSREQMNFKIIFHSIMNKYIEHWAITFLQFKFFQRFMEMLRWNLYITEYLRWKLILCNAYR